MSSPYVVNVSSVQDFMQCRYRWLAKWVLNRVPRHEGPALAAGKLLHTIFEDHYQLGVPLAEAAETRCEELIKQSLRAPAAEVATLVKAIETVNNFREALPFWRDTYVMDIPVLEVEEPFEIEFPECPGVVFRGRPDRVCLSSGLVWHVQNRGLAASMNFATYARLAKRHYHEHLYAEHLARKYADLGGYGGTMFNLVRKLKYRTNVGKKNEKVKTPAEMFWQHPMSIRLDSQQHKDVMAAMFKHVQAMHAYVVAYRQYGSEMIVPPPNEKMNGGFNGSSEDPFFKVLIGEISLDDDRWFKDREDTYAVADTDAGQDGD